MKFIVDAQLPVTLAKLIQWKGNDCLHTDDLPDKEKTGDDELRNISLGQNRIIISKDTDFLQSHLLKGVPPKLLMVTTGNIGNKQLIRIFDKNWEEIIKLFHHHSLIEVDNFEITVFR